MPRISQLPALTVPEANDEIAIVDASAATTKKITRADLLKGAALPADTVDTQAIADEAVTADKIDFATFVRPVAGDIDMATTGVKTVTLGFSPKLIKVYGVVTSNDVLDSVGIGTFDGTTFRNIATVSTSAVSSSRYYSSYFQMNVNGPAILCRASSWTITADGFTYNVATSSANVTVWYEAY